MLSAVLSLAACQVLSGGSPPAPSPSSSKTPAEFAKAPAAIFDDALAAIQNATAFHVRATEALVDGTRYEHDLVVGGSGVAGRVSVNGVAVDVLVAQDSTYLRGSAYIRMFLGATVANLAGDRWLKVGGADVVRAFTNRTDRNYLCAAFPAGHTGFRKSLSSINGQQAIQLIATNGSLYIASSGRPYPLRLEQLFTTGGPVNSVSNDWTDFDQPPVVMPPGSHADLPPAVSLPVPPPLACRTT